MVITDDNHFLFMEPISKKMEPSVNDALTTFVEELMSKAKENLDYTKGWHTCACKQAFSDSNTKTVSIAGKPYKTNSLALHYIRNHRSEVPAKDLKLIASGIKHAATFKNG